MNYPNTFDYLFQIFKSKKSVFIACIFLEIFGLNFFYQISTDLHAENQSVIDNGVKFQEIYRKRDEVITLSKKLKDLESKAIIDETNEKLKLLNDELNGTKNSLGLTNQLDNISARIDELEKLEKKQNSTKDNLIKETIQYLKNQKDTLDEKIKNIDLQKKQVASEACNQEVVNMIKNNGNSCPHNPSFTIPNSCESRMSSSLHSNFNSFCSSILDDYNQMKQDLFVKKSELSILENQIQNDPTKQDQVVVEDCIEQDGKVVGEKSCCGDLVNIDNICKVRPNPKSSTVVTRVVTKENKEIKFGACNDPKLVPGIVPLVSGPLKTKTSNYLQNSINSCKHVSGFATKSYASWVVDDNDFIECIRNSVRVCTVYADCGNHIRPLTCKADLCRKGVDMTPSDVASCYSDTSFAFSRTTKDLVNDNAERSRGGFNNATSTNQ